MPPKAKTDGNFLFFQERGMPRDLPDLYVPGWYVEMIDASDSVLVSGIFVSLTFFNLASPCLFLDFNFLVYTTIDNGDRKQERRRKSMYRSILLSLEKSPAPCENRFTAILTGKKPSLSRDSNPACSDRMPLLYPLCHLC